MRSERERERERDTRRALYRPGSLRFQQVDGYLKLDDKLISVCAWNSI